MSTRSLLFPVDHPEDEGGKLGSMNGVTPGRKIIKKIKFLEVTSGKMATAEHEKR